MSEEKVGLFDPADVTWDRVSPRLITLRRLVTIGLNVLVAVAVNIAFATGLNWWAYGAALGALLILSIWEWWLIGRQVRAIGYTERSDDLLIRKGILFRELVVVPYGRMQFVDVKSGPLERLFNLATVQLHTASPTTNSTIPGLHPEEAARLRDRLSTRGEAQMAGL